MRRHIRFCLFVSAVLFLFSLCACGSARNDTGAVIRKFSTEEGFYCTVRCDLTFDADIGGTAYPGLSQSFFGSGVMDQECGSCCISGELFSSLQGYDSDTEKRVDAYTVSTGSPCSFYRYGDTCYSDDLPNLFQPLVTMPLRFDGITDRFSLVQSNALLDGIYEVSVYQAELPAGNTLSSACTDAASFIDSEIALDSCRTEIVLMVYNDTALPAGFSVTFSPASESVPLSVISDSAGNTYALRSLSFQISYSDYGPIPDISVPEELARQAASGSAPGDTDISLFYDNLLPQSCVYTICNDDESYCCSILQPGYMQPDSQTKQSVSFCYSFSGADYEVYTYTLRDNCSPEEQAVFAQALPQLFTEESGFENVTATPVSTLTVGDLEVHYTVLTMNLTMDGINYTVLEVYSWTDIGDTTDTLEVEIAEYNASEDRTMVDPETELLSAYECVLDISSD